MTDQTRVEMLEPARASWYRHTFAAGSAAPEPGGELPAGWEGLYFPFDTPFAGLREDGSPADDLTSGIDLPRRMYAGEDTTFHRPLRFGALVRQSSRLGRVAEKRGHSGRLVFATIEREYWQDDALAVTSHWHDVFLEAAAAGGSGRDSAPEPDTTWQRDETTTVDPRRLFRFSAITFNTHRVHYDRDWARTVEGLEDLLVHGPLIRILPLDLVRTTWPEQRITTFSVRLQAPAWVDRPLRLLARSVDGGAEALALDGGSGVLARADAVWT